MYLAQPIKRNAQIYPNKVATLCGTRRRMWPEVTERVAKLAGALQAQGLKAGERVALLALNSDRYFESLTIWPASSTPAALPVFPKG